MERNAASAIPLDKPNMSDAELITWADNAARHTLSFNSDDFERVLTSARDNFTPQSWIELYEAPATSAFLDVLIEKHGSIASTIEGQPHIRSKGVVDGVFHWVVDLVMKEVTQTGGTTLTSEVPITFDIARTLDGRNSRGVVIAHWREAVVAPHPSPAGPKSVCKRDDLISFPLPPLTTMEREARLRFFMKDSPLHLIAHDKGITTTLCDSLLEHLRTFDSVTVLTPTLMSFKPNLAMDASIAPSCPNLDLDSEYVTDGSPTSGPWWRRASDYNREHSFLSKARAEKETLSRSYVTATANFEYYNLSRYLGPDIWGYFAEGGVSYSVVDTRDGRAHRNEPPRLSFCFPSDFRTITKLANIRSCSIASDTYRIDPRFAHAIYIGGPWGDYPKANVFAFVDINGTLYRIDAEFAHPVNELAEMISPARRSMNVFLDAVERHGNETAFQNACSFSTYLDSSTSPQLPPQQE